MESQMAEAAKDNDPFDLERFVEAQAGTCVLPKASIYETACDELHHGRKRSHWMWFVFPQMQGLGSSPMSQRFGIGSLDEARAYLAHPVLGPRLMEVTRLMLVARGGSLRDILGSPDDMKFRSSMTLFAQTAGAGSIYAEALDKLCEGKPDERTLARL
jgi:uncharacterized protein (DUF1810 family)